MAKGRAKKGKRAQPDSPTDSPDQVVKKQKTEGKQAKVIKKVKFTGDAPVDDNVPNKDRFEVASFFGDAYSKTLNQSNVERNNNKFYILQILKTKSAPTHYYVYFRWGRVGSDGRNSLINFDTDYAGAIAEFEDKLERKTVDGSYEELDIVFGDEMSPEEQEKKMIEDMKSSKLDARVSEMIKLLFDVKIIQQTLTEIGYDVKKMPLGKLSQKNIDRAYAVLKQILRELDKGKKAKGSRVNDLSSKFFTLIPHDVGYKSMRNFRLNSKELVEAKLELLDSLSNMKIARNITDESKGMNNVIESNYEKLNNKMNPVSKDGETWKIVEDFIQKGGCPSHNNYKLELLDCFELEREGENERFTEDIENKMLLWHGSRLTNFVGILSQGLRIAPPEAPVTGYMFGKGVYFADMVTKSANYCHPHLSNDVGLLLLCEVALGECNEKFFSDYNAANLPAGKSSTMGCGGYGPDPENYVDLDGVTVPMGPGGDIDVNGSLRYNEYIVYDISQIRMKYLVKVKFNNAYQY